MDGEGQEYLGQLFHQHILLLSKAESFRSLSSVRSYLNPIKSVLAAFPLLICFEPNCSFYFHNFLCHEAHNLILCCLKNEFFFFFFFFFPLLLLNNLFNNFNGRMLFHVVDEMENFCFSQWRHKS